MARIEQAVRQTPVKPDEEDLAHCRNREDAPVLEQARRELNLRGGDVQNVDADYEVLPADGYVFVDTSGGAVTVTMFALVDSSGAVLGDYDEKQLWVHRSGGSAVTVEDADGNTLATLSTDGRGLLFMANDGSWYRMSP